MPFIPQSDLLKNMTEAQKNLVSWLYSFFNNDSAINRTIRNVEPVYYLGIIAGSEFETYDATKIYIALELEFGSANTTIAIASITLQDQNNVAMHYMNESMPVWDTTAVALKFENTDIRAYNLWFSCLIRANYISMKFNGYRFTLV